jgi:ATP-dependent RNA helicase DDX52/ROK1
VVFVVSFSQRQDLWCMQDEFFNLLGAGGSFTRKRDREKVAEASVTPLQFADVPALTKTDMVAWRKAYSVSVEGDDIDFVPMTSFSELESRFQVSSETRLNLLAEEWTTPTLVQSEAIPVLFAGRDLICCAPTGSGKTASFVVPMLERLGGVHAEGGARALIVVPSRELAEQVHGVVERLSAGSALKSVLLNSERSANPKKWANNGVWDVIVATPMRLVKLVSDNVLSLACVEYFVLDEADRLFENDFLTQSDALFSSCTNAKLVKAMFSATIGEKPERLARAIMFHVGLLFLFVFCL